MKTLKLIFYSLIICYLTASHALAQSKGSVRGKLSDKGGKAVEFANIALMKAQDSTLVKGSLSDVEGNYEIENVNFGSYYLVVSHVDFQKTKSVVFTIDAKNLVQKIDLQLATNIKTLEAVTITAQKPVIEYKADRMTVNVENSIVNVGTNTLEVLKRVPGVAIDREGNISLKGKENVLVMINDKPNYLSVKQLENILKTMPSNQVSQIEVMTNPSAKYDAEGNAGIINIKLKKNQLAGFNGDVSISQIQGWFPKHNSGLNLNYLKGKWNLFANYNYSYDHTFWSYRMNRNFRGADGQVLANIDQHNFNQIRHQTNTLKVGADFAATDKTTLGFMLTGVGNHYNPYGESNAKILKNSVLDSTYSTIDESPEKWQDITLNLNFNHKFDTAGRELSAYIDYKYYNQSVNQRFTTRYFSPLGNQLGNAFILLGNLPGRIDIFSGKIDYTLPLKNKMKLEMGAKASYVHSDNNAQFFIEEGERVRPDRTRSNYFIYKEQISAGYLNFSKEWNKLSMQLGLRGEHTLAQGNQVTLDSTFVRDYFNLFPSLFLTYKKSENHEFTTSVSRRIDRPDYQNMNPFIYFIDPYTFEGGNPYLRPQFTTNVEVAHTFKGAFTTTLNYSFTNDVITQVMSQNDATRATIYMPDNISKFENFGVTVSASLPITSWWTSTNYLNIFRNRYFGNFQDGDLNKSQTAFTFNMDNSLTFGKGWTAELSGFYQSASVDGIMFVKPMGMVSAGVQKTFFNDKASIKLSFSDIFRTNYYRTTINYQNMDIRDEYRWDSKMLTLTFTYRFGGIKEARERKTGIDEEMERMGGKKK